ncbi:SprT-like protein [Saliterribacillus persicus]|uniref:SprT-like protein n=1 Tax=Saliterribacillus persicus TaxID=930114 RepID=A0A368XZZ6_9BACI|nr:SprT-like protein [Saliterribacillus persicus]
MNDKELHQLVDKLSRQFFDKAFEDKVIFNKRLRTTGGRYIPSKRLIELNPKYLVETNHEEFVGIIKHELCHYHLHIEGKGFMHRDRDFRQLLIKTNSPRHCQALPSMKDDFKYLYQCKKCGHQYKRRRRINVSKYRCGKCMKPLALIKET